MGESFTTNTSNHHTVFLNILQFDFKLYVKKDEKCVNIEWSIIMNVPQKYNLNNVYCVQGVKKYKWGFSLLSTQLSYRSKPALKKSNI